MSGAPKRSHEEGGAHSSSATRYPHEDTGSFLKLMSSGSVPAPSEHHQHHQPHPHSHSLSPYGFDSRMGAKVPRIESRDSERRSPLNSVYRVPSLSPNDNHLTRSPASEPRDPKDVREMRGERRENRNEVKDFYGDAKMDSKGERDAKFEGRGDDSVNKEMRFNRENYNDPKLEIKMEKDGHGHLNWRDHKEHHRGKRFSEGLSGNVDPWHASRAKSPGPSEFGKEVSGIEEGANVDGRRAVGESKTDLKSDDGFKDKDRKSKDLKHQDLGDQDKERYDRRAMQSMTWESKETVREVDRWEREKKEQKDWERLKEVEKNHIKRESWSTAEKEDSHNEKESGEASVKLPEQKYTILDQKEQKDTDSWKNAEGDKRKDRDADGEGERAEKRSRYYKKESDDGCRGSGEGATEREKDVFNCGVQQRKQMLRPEGSPQMTNCDHFRSRAQDNEGSQGKSEVSSVVYKVGKCMQELLNLWNEYESSHPDKSGDVINHGLTLEVRIPAEHVTAINCQVKGGQLWGTDIYTADSDLVAVLMHTGYCRPTSLPPPPAIQELLATIRVLPPRDCYTSKLRNNVRSRSWGAGIGCSYRVERCSILKRGGGAIELEPCLTHLSTVEPTLAPVAVERSITTRAAASNALRQQKFVREVTIQYNLCNEPWIKYSISVVADKGLKKPFFTSARLKRGEVLYLETHSCRYELCFAGEKKVKAAQASKRLEAETEKSQYHNSLLSNGEKSDSDNLLVDVFRWSRCKKPLPQKVMRSLGIPLPSDHVEVVEENLEWEDVQWSQTGVWIAGKEYILARVHFLSAN